VSRAARPPVLQPTAGQAISATRRMVPETDPGCSNAHCYADSIPNKNRKSSLAGADSSPVWSGLGEGGGNRGEGGGGGQGHSAKHHPPDGKDAALLGVVGRERSTLLSGRFSPALHWYRILTSPRRRRIRQRYWTHHRIDNVEGNLAEDRTVAEIAEERIQRSGRSH
jgi:hypothetical protein